MVVETEGSSWLKTFLSPVMILWRKIVCAIDESNASHNDQVRLKHFFVFILVGFPTMLIYGGYNLFQNYIPLACLVFLSALSLVSSGLILLKFPSNKNIYRFGEVIYSVLLLYMLVIGGEGGSKALWIYTFPLVVLFLMGMKEGIAWAFSIMILFLILVSVPLPFLKVYPYSSEFIVRFFSVYLIIVTVTFCFEYLRDSYVKQIQEGHKRFQEIVEHSRDILYRRDVRTGEYQYISKAFGEILGYSPTEMSSMVFTGIEKLIHPEDREKHSTVIKKIGTVSPHSPHGSVVEYRMRHKDGTYYWFSDQMVLIFDAMGKPEFVIGSNREITELRRIRLELKDSKDQLKTILNSIDAHVYVADMKSYEILFMNNKMKQDFGWDLEGKICWREFRADTSPCEHCSNNDLIDTDGNSTGVIEWECHNPITNNWYNNYDRAVRWVDGRWVRLQIAVDITRMKVMEEERKNNEAILQHAAQLEAIGNLAGGIAHDFNNLLQVQLGYLSMIEEEEDLSPVVKSQLQEIETASYRAVELANRLITFATGGAPLRREQNISLLIRNVVEELGDDDKHTYNLSLQPDLWQTLIDYNQMVVVLKNLISNGCESMPEGGELFISAENIAVNEDFKQEGKNLPLGRYVRVSLQDNGCGIDEISLSRVYDPYYSSKSQENQKGLGLGLSIVNSITRRHDGYISIYSKPDEGTTVDVFLPSGTKVKDKNNQIESTISKPQYIETQRILLMDDEEMIRKIAVNMFSHLGFEVDTAKDGAEAIALYTNLLAEGKRYKLVVLDLTVINGMGGEKAIEGLSDVDSKVKAVVSSGYYGDPILENYSEFGFLGSLVKPYTLENAKALFEKIGILPVASK